MWRSTHPTRPSLRIAILLEMVVIVCFLALYLHHHHHLQPQTTNADHPHPQSHHHHHSALAIFFIYALFTITKSLLFLYSVHVHDFSSLFFQMAQVISVAMAITMPALCIFANFLMPNLCAKVLGMEMMEMGMGMAFMLFLLVALEIAILKIVRHHAILYERGEPVLAETHKSFAIHVSSHSHLV